MKRKMAIFLMLCTAAIVYGFEGNDDNVTRDYYVQLYKSQPYIPDFRQLFPSESDKRDYKKLRDYLNNKEEILRILKMAGDEYYYGLSYSRLYATDYIQSLEDELRTRDPNDKILLRLNSVRPSFDYNGTFTVGYVEAEILPVIRARYAEAARRDSMNQEAYMQIQSNVDAIQQDIFQAEQAIYASLSPEFRDQDFRIWISMTFSGLIAVILFAFFLIIYRRSDSSLYRQLLSSSGLQFITVFVLIIAIILFGILNVLGGSELAAILSGISGYILGKGGATVSEMMSREKEDNSRTIVPDGIANTDERNNMDVPVDYPEGIQPVKRTENQVDILPESVTPFPEKKEEVLPEQDEKFFPGGY